MTPSPFRRFLALAAISAFPLLSVGNAASSELSVYHVGNSLTGDLLAEGRGQNGYEALLGAGASYAYDLRFGEPLRVAADNPLTTFASRPGGTSLGEELATGAYAQVVLQPWNNPVTPATAGFTASTYEQELAAFRSLAGLAREARSNVELFLYATWSDTGQVDLFAEGTTRAEGSAEVLARWNRPAIAATDPFYASAAVYEQFAEDLRTGDSENAGLDITVINAGQLFADLIEDDNGIEASDLYRDGLHASRLGRYAAGYLAATTLLEDEPLLALPSLYTTQGDADFVTTVPVTEAQAQIVRAAAVLVVPEPGSVAMALAAAPLLLLRRRRAAA